jgi:hypothetical protein
VIPLSGVPKPDARGLGRNVSRIVMAAFALRFPGLWREQAHVAMALIAVNALLARAQTGLANPSLVWPVFLAALLYAFLIVRNGRLRAVMPERPSFFAIATFITLMVVPHLAFQSMMQRAQVEESPFAFAAAGLTCAFLVRVMFLFGVRASIVWTLAWAGMGYSLFLTAAEIVSRSNLSHQLPLIWVAAVGTVLVWSVCLGILWAIPRLRHSRALAIGGFQLVVVSSVIASSAIAQLVDFGTLHFLAPGIFVVLGAGLLVDMLSWVLGFRPYVERARERSRKRLPRSTRLFRWGTFSEFFARMAPGWWRECGHVFLAFFALNWVLCPLNLAGLVLVFVQGLFLSFLILRGMRLREIERMSHRPTITGVTVALCLLALPYILIGVLFPFAANATALQQPTSALVVPAIVTGIAVSAVFASFIRSVTLFRLWPSVGALAIAFVAAPMNVGFINSIVPGDLLEILGVGAIGLSLVSTLAALLVLLPSLALVGFSVRVGRRMRFSDLAGVVLLWGGVALMAGLGYWLALLLYSNISQLMLPVMIIPFAACFTTISCLFIDFLLIPLTRLRQLPHPR